MEVMEPILQPGGKDDEYIASDRVTELYDETSPSEILPTDTKPPFMVLPSTPGWVPTPLARSPHPSLPTGLAWSPDGTSLAVASEDAIIRVFRPPGTEGLGTAVNLKETECVYDFAWCRASGRLVATGRYQPVHLWHLGGETPVIAATYKCINQLDELSAAHSVALAEDGETLYCGLRGEVRVFATSRPGRESTTHLVGEGGQRGILSCLALNPSLPVYAAGCYNRTTGLYCRSSGQLLCLLAGQRGGVTQVTFSSCGTFLYTGGRKDPEILCWDLRRPGTLLATLAREAATNQRTQFTLSPCSGLLASANTDGSVRVWELARPQAPTHAWLLHSDAVVGLGWHPGGARLASCSGQRHFPDPGEEQEGVEEERVVCLWNLT